jgi:glycosyltransferase involved in cell wall biosynthesis
MPTVDPHTVAVIVPIYNGQQYLRETVDSILSQTHPPTEILLIDDGSTDASLSIARSYESQVKEPRVKVIPRANSGVCATRNFAASITQCEWLAFIDQDDNWEPENLAHQLANLSQHPQADMSYADRRILGYAPDTDSFVLSEPQSMPAAEDFGAVVMNRCPFTPVSAIIRRTTYLAVGGFNQKHAGAEDWDLWLRLCAHGARFAHCPEPLIQYRLHLGAVSRGALKMLNASLGVVDQNIRPRLTPLQRLTTLPRIKSRLEAHCAILMRDNQTPASLAMMLRSILRDPFHFVDRYKVAAHMLLSKSDSTASLLKMLKAS